MRIQRDIQEGHLKFDNKMKLDGHPFPQNMIGFFVNMVTAEEKGRVKVLTSAKAKQDGAVDPARQVMLEQVHGEAPRVLRSHIEVGESSRAKPRVTTRILLNNWQRQLEKEHYQKRRHKEEKSRFEEEARRKRTGAVHARTRACTLGCAFFRHCWNEGLKLPTLRNCPECSDRYFEYRQETVNRRSVHERIGRIYPNDDQRQKIIEVIDHPRKRQADQRWADQEEDEYIWQEGQWCPPRLRKSQKRRVQRLRNRELRQAGVQKKQVWHPKDKPEG
jgi:predicted  nucleic acid-binding Zn-ribbon protein